MISRFPGVFVLVLVSSYFLLWRRTARLVAPGHPARRRTGAGAALLIGLAIVFIKVLVADTGGDAYLDLAIFGMLLACSATPLALAVVLPDSAARCLVLRLASLLLAVVGLYALVVVLPSCVMVAAQRHDDARIARNHLLGAIVIVVAIPGLLCTLWWPPVKR